MAELEYRELAQDELATELTSVPEWEIVENRLQRSFEFQRYQECIVFASAVGFLADRLNHHPDLALGYGRVIVSISTHVTNGLSPYDFELARRIDAIHG